MDRLLLLCQAADSKNRIQILSDSPTSREDVSPLQPHYPSSSQPSHSKQQQQLLVSDFNDPSSSSPSTTPDRGSDLMNVSMSPNPTPTARVKKEFDSYPQQQQQQVSQQQQQSVVETKQFSCNENNDISPRFFTNKKRTKCANLNDRKKSLDPQTILNNFNKDINNAHLQAIPNHLFGAFNSGDLHCLQDIIQTSTTDYVTFKTKALDDPKVGRQHFMAFFEAILDSHPDAYIIASDTQFTTTTTMVTTVSIKGTKALPSEKEHYFMKPRLVDNMDLQGYSNNDVGLLRQLESYLITGHKPIEVEYSGKMTLTFQAPPKATTTATATTTAASGGMLDGEEEERATNGEPLERRNSFGEDFSKKLLFQQGSAKQQQQNRYRISDVVFSYNLSSFREAVIIPTQES